MRRRKRSFTTSWHDEGPAPPSLARQNIGASTKALLGEVSRATGAASADKTSATRTPAQANMGAAVGKRKHLSDLSAPAPPNAQSQLSPKKTQTPLLLQRRFVAPSASDQKGASSTIKISVAEPKRRMRLATIAHVVATSKAGEKKSTKSPSPPRPRPMARQRTEQLIRAAVKELAEVPHTTQRLTIEKRASILLEALHKSGGSKLLHELAEQQTTLVTLSDTTDPAANPGLNGEDTSNANEEVAADGNAALSKFDFGPLTLTVKRAGSSIDNALLAQTANSTRAEQDNLSSGCENGPLPRNRSLQEARRRVVRKLRLVGRMAVVMRNYRQEAEEKLRRKRIEERWDTVRQIAKASLAVLHMRKGVKTSVLSGAWFEDYPLLRRNLVVSPGQRSRAAVRQIADELHRTRAFSDFSIPMPARRRIARSAELEVCPAGQAVFHQNDEGGYFYVILTGKVSIQVRDKEPLWSGDESDNGRPRSTGRVGQLAQGRQRRVSLGDAPRKMNQRNGSVNAEQRPSLSRGTDKTSKSNRPRSQRAHHAQRKQQRNDQEKQTSRRDQRIQGERAGAADGQAKERNKRANLETRIFGAKRAAELHQQAARHHGKEKKEASFTEVAVLRAGESFGGLGLRTVALGKRKASAIAVEYTELLRIEAVDYREVFMSHEMERIARPVRFLKSMPEFAMLVDDELTQLAYSVRATRFASGTVICRQGQPIDDTLQFGIVTIGRCRRIKLLRHDGSEPTSSDLAQYAQSNQAEETDEDQNKGAVSPQQPANASGVPDQLQEYSFQSVGPGSILADRAALVDGQNTVHTHSCTVIADTCVEVFFIPRNSLVFALRNGGKFRELLRKLTPAPTPNKLRDLLEQRNMWIRFQQRFVRETLNETRKGQKIREAIDRSRLTAAHVHGPLLLHNVPHSRVEEEEA